MLPLDWPVCTNFTEQHFSPHFAGAHTQCGGVGNGAEVISLL
jgi:hypothetical protein